MNANSIHRTVNSNVISFVDIVSDFHKFKEIDYSNYSKNVEESMYEVMYDNLKGVNYGRNTYDFATIVENTGGGEHFDIIGDEYFIGDARKMKDYSCIDMENFVPSGTSDRLPMQILKVNGNYYLAKKSSVLKFSGIDREATVFIKVDDRSGNDLNKFIALGDDKWLVTTDRDLNMFDSIDLYDLGGNV